MLTKTQLNNEILIHAAEQFLCFNDKNSDARTQFIQLIENNSSLEIEALPKNIGVIWQPFENKLIGDVIDLISDYADSMKSFIVNGFHQNKFDCLKQRLYTKDDIVQIDDDIFDNIKRYDLINYFSDADGVDFNLYFHSMEEWLINQWKSDNYSDLYHKIARRFNISNDELMSSGEHELCFIICFLEQFKLIGQDAQFSLYSEAVLSINSEIVDNETALMKNG